MGAAPIRGIFLRCRLAILLICLFVVPLNGQTRESLLKAGYIEKFTHFVQWPQKIAETNPTVEFKIAVIGKNNFGTDLEEIFSKTKIMEREVKIVYINTPEQIDGCMILFISGSEKANLDKILEKTSGKPILTISDTQDFGKAGVMINMFYEGSYIKYEINKNTLEKSGLLINSMLLNYAVII